MSTVVFTTFQCLQCGRGIGRQRTDERSMRGSAFWLRARCPVCGGNAVADDYEVYRLEDPLPKEAYGPHKSGRPRGSKTRRVLENPGECPQCGTELPATRPNGQIYCTDKCRTRFNDRIRRGKLVPDWVFE